MKKRNLILLILPLFIAGFQPLIHAIEPVPENIQTAIRKSIPLLEYSSHEFLANAGGCHSCHGQALGSITFALARQTGFEVNDSLHQEAIDSIVSHLKRSKVRFAEREDPVAIIIGRGYDLWALSFNGYKANKYIHLLVRNFIQRQTKEGSWVSPNSRPPLEYSSFTGTALVAKGIQSYAPPYMAGEVKLCIQKAKMWLSRAIPLTNEERIFQLLGLSWTNADQELIRKQAAKLLALQHPDGGWSQLDSLSSDAYATGQALYVLNQTNQLATNAPEYKKGLSFLLNTQKDGGSWLVKSRSFAVVNYVYSGFPHGDDQFISAAGSSWATMALLLAAKPN